MAKRKSFEVLWGELGRHGESWVDMGRGVSVAESWGELVDERLSRVSVAADGRVALVFTLIY
jgi:hypothetical protein